MRHNTIRDVEAAMLSDVCHDVKIEPELIPVENTDLEAGTTVQDGARLDISAVGVWRSHERTFFDVRITHPHAASYVNKSLDSVLKAAETEKMKKYGDSVLQVEKGSFVPLVFATNGAMGEQCSKLQQQLAKLISEKKGDNYSVVMTHIRTRIRVALLKSILIAIRGYRGPSKKSYDQVLPITEIDFGQYEISHRDD